MLELFRMFFSKRQLKLTSLRCFFEFVKVIKLIEDGLFHFTFEVDEVRYDARLFIVYIRTLGIEVLIYFCGNVLHEDFDDSPMVCKPGDVDRGRTSLRLYLPCALGEQKATKLFIVIEGGPMKWRESNCLYEVDISVMLH